MSVYYPGCDDSITDPQCSDCPPKELGDVRHFAIWDTNAPFTDITSAAEWQTKICDKEVYSFPFARGSVEFTETESPGFGNQEVSLDGYDVVATVSEPNYVANCNFWNDIKRQKTWGFMYVTETQIHQSEKAVQFIPKPIIGEDKKAAIVWQIIVKWSQEDIPCPFDEPTGVFDQCIEST